MSTITMKTAGRTMGEVAIIYCGVLATDYTVRGFKVLYKKGHKYLTERKLKRQVADID